MVEWMRTTTKVGTAAVGGRLADVAKGGERED
jgi:hypothetical protein